jgi:hypothetical protein
MKISELIKDLEKAKKKKGDIDVLIWDFEDDNLYSNPETDVVNCADIFSLDCWMTYYFRIKPATK